ncbi:ABC transporter ATP-binding protein [Leucobacter triazinivorans]|uniref:ABC transporter ATP-binding protein n=1 Tax=Leucobacter triazinivorans TaxID=1784719 RepID=A0A4P6KIT2_9MICO|nr:ABC transporter ATP-binding protein [Leucobacter triazinivorans]QBE50260.1 ABC transporter ATP-binding protein [Leucobacter triazinivorans]
MSRTARSRRPRRDATAQTRGPRATLKQLLPYLFEQRGKLLFIAGLSVLGALASLAQPLLVGSVIERVQQSAALGGLLWALVGLVLASALLNSYQHYLLQCMGEGVVLASRKRLVAKILHLPIAEFDRRRTGDLVSRVGSDTTLLRAVLTQGLVEAVGGALLFAGALIGMLVIDPLLFAVTFGVIVVAVVVVVALSARIRPAVARSQEKVGDLAAAVDRAIGSMRTIRAAGAAKREQREIEGEAAEAYRLGIRVARISALIVPVSFIAMQVSFLAVLGIGGFRVATGAITIAQLVTFIIFLFLMIMPLGQAFGAISAVNQALGALGRIQEITSLPTETERDQQLSPLGRTAPLADSGLDYAAAIRFSDVHFTYRSAAPERADARELVRGGRGGSRRDAEAAPAEIIETPVLHGVGFAVPRGSRVALVGPSGAGKSTILALIERFYDPDRGAVSLYGADLRTLDRAEVRAQLGYVEQDAPVLAGSLRDNLRIAAPESTDAACERVLRAVNLGGLLDRSAAAERARRTDTAGLTETDGSDRALSDAELAAALDSQVGENGIMLSGGEKQRLAIARALLTAPPILLLDESTASLDGVNERLMRDALDSVATGRTLIVIAHRLSTVIDSDKIVVLDEGRVIGEGTHSELLESTPLYRELAQHQLLVPEQS